MDQTRKVIFITGAASGIGRATARLFAGKGWFVGLTDINAGDLALLEAELGNENCYTAQLDVSDREAYQAVLREFSQQTAGRLDVLFNNAGIGDGTMFAETNFADIEKIIQVNLMGVLIGIHAAYPMLKNTPNSLCFSTSSSSAILGVAGLATYSATKHAVKGLTEALSIEFSRDDIRAAAALPGKIDTAMMPDELRKSAPEKGMWRIVPAEAVAEVVWASYHDTEGKLHWFIPEDLNKLQQFVAADVEAARDASIKFFFSEAGGTYANAEK